MLVVEVQYSEKAVWNVCTGRHSGWSSSYHEVHWHDKTKSSICCKVPIAGFGYIKGNPQQRKKEQCRNEKPGRVTVYRKGQPKVASEI